MRAFLAVELSEEAHGALTRAMSDLRRRLPSARWVRSAALHITMRFLGDQPEELLVRVGDLVAGELNPLSPVEVSLGGAGFFPHERRPRVAWLGGASSGLESWAAAIERGVRAAGVEPERRPFSLHVTLARLDRPWGVADIETFTTLVGKLRLTSYVAREVVLFRSELTPAGAVYTALRRLAVGG